MILVKTAEKYGHCSETSQTNIEQIINKFLEYFHGQWWGKRLLVYFQTLWEILCKTFDFVEPYEKCRPEE